MVSLKSERELSMMRKASSFVARILDEVVSMAEPGVSTLALDQLAERRCKELGVIPAFKGYHGFPGCVCISLNDEVVHGIPSAKRILKDGDIVGLDFGVSFQGWYGDSARTIGIGKISKEARQLMAVTQEGLKKGIEQCHEGKRVFDIGHAIQNYVEGFGYSVVREFVGHGIGSALHEEPQVPNFGPKGKGMVLKAGMVLAIEPMINAGSFEVRVLSDGWTAVTADHSLSAHFEHTVAITPKGPEILTI
ncbi:MAG TPA: type I methionyl aminopeptidase [Bdellovibrionales bacterium]|nr:type I methionyl aminopeptidase [Bdellovibrionales bacterium]